VAGIAHRDLAPRRANRACNQRNGCSHRQFRSYACSKPLHF
jgi:hypothetical protein